MKSRPLGIASDRRFVLAFAASLALLLFGACGVTDEQLLQLGAPQSLENIESVRQNDGGGSAGSFYPLAIGNRWTYSGETSISQDSDPVFAAHVREEHTVIGTEILFGREYTVEEQVETRDSNPRIWTIWLRHRQDRAGLYGADVNVTEPPAGRLVGRPEARADGDMPEAPVAGLRERLLKAVEPQLRDGYVEACDRLLRKMEAVNAALGAMPNGRAQAGPPGGIMPGEITRLKYPLHPGQTWAIREDPLLVTATVEKHEVLDLAAGRINGYRIAIAHELLTSDDVALVWYGRDGYLGMYAHLVVEIIDPGGNTSGTLVADERLFLDSLDLVGR